MPRLLFPKDWQNFQRLHQLNPSAPTKALQTAIQAASNWFPTLHHPYVNQRELVPSCKTLPRAGVWRGKETSAAWEPTPHRRASAPGPRLRQEL